MDDSNDDIDVNNDDDARTFERSCVVCRKTFTSKNRYDVHCRRHRNVLTSSSTFRLLDPIPSNVLASISPLSGSSPPRTSPKSLSSPNAISSSTSTSAMKKERSFRVKTLILKKHFLSVGQTHSIARKITQNCYHRNYSHLIKIARFRSMWKINRKNSRNLHNYPSIC